ncbi:MAG: hypothetical protein L3J76_05335, partial [Candidatus Hydrothermae bacterium]|nr:hypothetical protein [Candidatus Hydrothermae bacterium]
QSGTVLDTLSLSTGVRDLRVTRTTPPYVLVALAQGPVLRFPLSTLAFPDTLQLQGITHLFLYPTLVDRVYAVSESGWLYEANPLTRAVLDSVHVGVQGGPGLVDAFQYIYVADGPRLVRVDAVSFTVVDTPLTLPDTLTTLHYADPVVWGGARVGTVIRWNAATLQGGVGFTVPEGVVTVVYRTVTGVAESARPRTAQLRLTRTASGWMLRFPEEADVSLWRADGRRVGRWPAVRQVALGRSRGVYVLDVNGTRRRLLIP